jgi:GNAT superfamily N-acetyltransferase
MTEETDGARIRRATTKDADRIGELWLDLLHEQAGHDARIGVADDALERWRNDFPMWLDDETRRLFVAEVDGTIEGFASAHRWGPPPIYAESEEVYLDEVYVAPDARRRGLGSALVDAVRTWAEGLGAERVRLQVLAENDSGNRFWEGHEAVPLVVTRTIECTPAEDAAEDEGSKKIGFW